MTRKGYYRCHHSVAFMPLTRDRGPVYEIGTEGATPSRGTTGRRAGPTANSKSARIAFNSLASRHMAARASAHGDLISRSETAHYRPLLLGLHQGIVVDVSGLTTCRSPDLNIEVKLQGVTPRSGRGTRRVRFSSPRPCRAVHRVVMKILHVFRGGCEPHALYDLCGKAELMHAARGS